MLSAMRRALREGSFEQPRPNGETCPGAVFHDFRVPTLITTAMFGFAALCLVVAALIP